MDEQISKPEPAIADAGPAVADETAQESSGLKALNEIDQLLEKIAENRRRQSLWTGVGTVVILLILVVFMVNLASFVESFDTGRLSEALIRRGDMLVQAPEVLDVQRDFRQIFLPAYQEALAAQFEKRLPQLVAAMEKEGDQLVDYTQKDLRARVTARLLKSFAQMEKKLVDKYGKSTPTPEQLQKGLEKFQANFGNDVAVVLDRNLGQARSKLLELYAACLAFQECPEYRTIDKLPPEEVENLLLETFLELWIYNLNPGRGAVRAAVANGGI